MDDIVDRLNGRYSMGPHLPNGNPEFGWRQFDATPINIEAAKLIETLRTALTNLSQSYIARSGLVPYEIRWEKNPGIDYYASPEWLAAQEALALGRAKRRGDTFMQPSEEGMQADEESLTLPRTCP